MPRFQTETLPDFLSANIEGGEYFDWYYATAADRAQGIRTPIADTAYAEPFVFRQKDMRGWWLNAHHDRPGGLRAPLPTAWVPQSKPIRFTELGCAAIDKGSNSPNLFLDDKSSENALPPFSLGVRDDLQQRAHLEAVIDHWSDPGRNPVSPVYAAPMVDVANIALWAWDARPVPAFPRDRALWADAANWDRGHWLSGRLGTLTLSDLLVAVLAEYGLGNIVLEGVTGSLDGFAIAGPATGRSVLEPLCDAFGIVLVQRGHSLVLRGMRGQVPALQLGADDLADTDDAGGGHTILRKPDAEVPASMRLGVHDPDLDDRPATVDAVRTGTASRAVASIDLPVTLERARALGLSQTMLQSAWTAREMLTMHLPPSRLAVEAGDIIDLQIDDRDCSFRVSRVTDAGARQIEAARHEFADHTPVRGERRRRAARTASGLLAPVLDLLDLPGLSGIADTPRLYAAAHASPFLPVALYRAQGDGARTFVTTIERPATMGALVAPLGTGASWRFDEAGVIEVEIFAGSLDSASQGDVLGGANLAAIATSDGQWEIIQFRDAELVATRRYRLSGLLRGQGGSEHLIATEKPAGSRFILLDDTLVAVPVGLADIGREFTWRHGPANRDVTEAIYADQTFAPTGTALMPRAPVDLSAIRDHDTGDIALVWIRRTRVPGERWDVAEEPLGETSERYRLRILAADGETVLRQTETLEPAFAYSAIQQTADFAGLPAVLTFGVAQLGDTIGAGIETRRTIHV